MGSMDSVDPEAVQCMHLLTNLHAFNNSPVLRHRRHHLGSKREMLAFSDVLHRTPAETLLLHQHSHMLTSHSWQRAISHPCSRSRTSTPCLLIGQPLSWPNPPLMADTGQSEGLEGAGGKLLETIATKNDGTAT